MTPRLFRFALAPLALALVFASWLAVRPPAAEAHPLGNFTINRLALLDLTADSARLRYVIDMAEIPAFQEIRAIDQDGDGAVSDTEAAAYLNARVPALQRGIALIVGGRVQDLALTGQSLTTPEGQAGLPTLRIVLDFEAEATEAWSGPLDASLRDTNYADRLGWRSIVVRPGEGIVLATTSVPTVDDTAELTAYPADRLKSPPNLAQASFRFEANGVGGPAPSLVPAARPVETRARDVSGGGFAGLVSKERLTPTFVALSLLAAMAWGAAHALGPGHGKTIVAAYLVGSRSTPAHAVLLGLTVTATHTSMVILLGLVTLYASQHFASEDLYLWLNLASGLLVVAMGGFLFATRLLQIRSPRTHAHDHFEPHSHGPAGHTHDHVPAQATVQTHGRLQVHRRAAPVHSHDAIDSEAAALAHARSHLPKAPGWRGLVLLGISGGILPCPTALVVMLGAIALDRVAYGLVLVLAFSVGLAGVLTAIGLVLVWAKSALNGSTRLSGLLNAPRFALWLRAAPIASAFVILVAGLVLTSRALSLA